MGDRGPVVNSGPVLFGTTSWRHSGPPLWAGVLTLQKRPWRIFMRGYRLALRRSLGVPSLTTGSSHKDLNVSSAFWTCWTCGSMVHPSVNRSDYSLRFVCPGGGSSSAAATSLMAAWTRGPNSRASLPNRMGKGRSSTFKMSKVCGFLAYHRVNLIMGHVHICLLTPAMAVHRRGGLSPGTRWALIIDTELPVSNRAVMRWQPWCTGRVRGGL